MNSITDELSHYAFTRFVQSISTRWEGLQKTDINGIAHIDSMYPERIQARQNIIRQILRRPQLP